MFISPNTYRDRLKRKLELREVKWLGCPMSHSMFSVVLHYNISEHLQHFDSKPMNFFFFNLESFSVQNFLIYFWPRHMACGILVPWLGIEPAPPALEAWSLNHWTAREVPFFFFKKNQGHPLPFYRLNWSWGPLPGTLQRLEEIP